MYKRDDLGSEPDIMTLVNGDADGDGDALDDTSRDHHATTPSPPAGAQAMREASG
jgi:hypothetical protein